MSSSVVPLGSGPSSRLARYSLAASSVPMVLTVVARAEARTAEPAYVGNPHAALTRWRVRRQAVPGEIADQRSLGRVPDAVNPTELFAVAGHSQVDLPAGRTAEDAVAWDRATAQRDGADGDVVRFAEPVLAAPEPHLPGLAAGFPLTALDAVGARLLAPRLLAPRARLRGRTDP